MFGLKELLLTGVLFTVGAVLSVILLKKATGKKRLLLIPAVIIFIVIGVSFVFFADLPSSSAENDAYSVLSSGSGYPALSLKITDAEFSGISPYIAVRIKNDSDTDCIYGESFDIKRKAVNGEYVSSLNKFMSDSLAFILKSHTEQERKYYIDEKIIPEGGVYRFELPFLVKTKEEEYTAFAEFRVQSGVSGRNDLNFTMEKVVYENGSFSAETKASALPDIRISPEMRLFTEDDGEWNEIGVLNEIALSKDNFDKRIWHSDVTDQISAVDFRADNKRAWQIYEKGEKSGNSRVYVLLQQDDGSFYFSAGEYNVSGLTEPNSDASYFRWICLLSEKE